MQVDLSFEQPTRLELQGGRIPGSRGQSGAFHFRRLLVTSSAATHHLLKSQELGEFNGLPKNLYRWRVAMARIQQTKGDLEGALDLLHEAERLYLSDFSPNVRPVAAWRTRVWIAQGRLDDALGWARERGLSAEDNLSHLREFEHITLAQVLLARYENDRTDSAICEVVGLLERLLQAAQAGGRLGNVLEILVLQALAHHAQER